MTNPFSTPFEVNKIHQLLSKDKIEDVISLLLLTIERFSDDVQRMYDQGMKRLSISDKLSSYIEIKYGMENIRNLVIKLSASLNRIKMEFVVKMGDWDKLDLGRAKLIDSLLMLCPELIEFNSTYHTVFRRDLFPANFSSENTGELVRETIEKIEDHIFLIERIEGISTKISLR